MDLTMHGVRIVILTFLYLNTFLTFAQTAEDIKLERLTASDGLSNDQINYVFQDKDGFIWIGTLSGLNRYDGYEIKTYYHQEDDSTSIVGNTMMWMSYGPENTIWVKTSSGISVYDASTDRFSIPTKYLDLLQTEPVLIQQMIADEQGNYWFVINNRGMVGLDENGELIEVNTEKEASIKITSNNINDVYLDAKNQLWLVHETGMVDVINVDSRKVIRKYGIPESLNDQVEKWEIYVDNAQDAWLFSHTNPFGVYYLNTTSGKTKIYETPILGSNLVTSVVQSAGGMMWIGTDHGGVTIFNKSTQTSRILKNDQDGPKSLVNDNVNTLFKDESNAIWVGTTKSGLSYYHPAASSFSHYRSQNKELAYNDMSSFAETTSNELWIGTNGKGLLKFDLNSKRFVDIGSELKRNQPEVIVSLLMDSQQTLWIGTYLDGVSRYRDGRLERFRLPGDDDLSVWEVFEDSRRNIWIGTLNKGVYKYDPVTESIEVIDMNAGLMANYVTCIEEDDEGNIWLGTGNGLSRYNPQSKEIMSYQSGNSSNTLANNSVMSLRSTRNYLWVGTLNGLNRLDVQKDQMITLRKDQGLSSNIIMAIEEDSERNIWLSTDHGITKIIKVDGSYEYHNYDISDGLQAENFTEDASYKTKNGKLIFSGQNGFNLFDPNEIDIKRNAPDVLITGLSVNNEEIITGKKYNGRVLLTKSIRETSNVQLKHFENSVSINYQALSFFQSGKLRYQYQLEGFDHEWINAPAELRKVNYSNLDYGNYTFRIRASAGTNSWTEPVMLAFSVAPPFWETPLAFVLYFISIVILLYLTRTYIVRRERMKAGIENERLEVERQHQLDLMKIKFFTNISHEFRTPLSLVVTPIERMINDFEKVKKDDLVLVHRNAKRLMTLVNQLLDFRKIEANQHRLSQSSGDLIAFLQDVVDSFSDWSREKDIPVVFQSEVKSYYTFFDKDKMEKIMFNLLSNAFKFTLSGGKITVDFELQRNSDGNRALISVSDTGIGIPKEKQELIFNRFFQNELSGGIINNGTGIGLSITKEFVELHKGSIAVDSMPNMGTTFLVDLPLKEISSDEDMADELGKKLAEAANNPETNNATDHSSLPTVLLVEDNYDFRFYLKDNLKQHYNIHVASNGKDAWKSILNKQPDIVISDVMMPIMDGHELCEKIKGDPRTLHIPVIMLTAQSSDRHRVQGLEAGAIEYISKPFNFEILISSINSALKFQKRVKESGKKIEVSPEAAEIVSLDEQLINKAVALVEENMSNSEFSVEDLSHELGYSRGHFYQKVLRLTGQTPIDFIRNIRMKRAADLLQRSQLNVSEVAYKVGYNNPKLFSRYFKSVYNKYPSEFRTKTEKN